MNSPASAASRWARAAAASPPASTTWTTPTLYVNKGIGFGLRIRYGVRPEVAVLTLVPRPQAAG